jgi:hypothetical protein
VLEGKPKILFIMKKILYCLMLAVMLTAYGGGAKAFEANQKAPKKVGDIITVNGAVGVVFEVSDDGQHGKVMSVSTTKCTWGKAKVWSSRYGNGWRLPNKSELNTIYKKQDILNSALSANGHRTLRNSWHWASKEFSEGRAWVFNMDDGDSLDETKRMDHYVRAVSAF